MQDPMQRYEDEAVPLQSVLLLLLSSGAGALLAVNVLPVLTPGFLASMSADGLKAFWYLSRSSAFAAYLLLWLSMVFGLVITNRMAKLWPGGPQAFDLHQHVSLLAIAFSLFHAVILLGDQYLKPTFPQIMLPFGMEAYRPLWVGLGQVAFYLSLLVSLTFYARKWLGRRLWRLIHITSYAGYFLVLFHGIYSGTDTLTVAALSMYALTGVSVLFLTIYRVLSAILPAPRRTKRAVAASTGES